MLAVSKKSESVGIGLSLPIDVFAIRKPVVHISVQALSVVNVHHFVLKQYLFRRSCREMSIVIWSCAVATYLLMASSPAIGAGHTNCGVERQCDVLLILIQIGSMRPYLYQD